MLLFFKLLFIIFAVVLSQISLAVNTDLANAKRFINLLNATPILQAKVVQASYKHFKDKTDKKILLQQLNADFFFKQPLKFKWQVKDDFQQQIIANGKLSWLYEPDIEQVIIKNITNYDIAHTPILLLGSSAAKIIKDFKVAILEQSRVKKFTFLPKKPDSMFNRLEVNFNLDMIQLIRVYDNLSNLTEFSFTQVKKLQSLPDSMFNFVIPKGTSVVK